MASSNAPSKRRMGVTVLRLQLERVQRAVSGSPAPIQRLIGGALGIADLLDLAVVNGEEVRALGTFTAQLTVSITEAVAAAQQPALAERLSSLEPLAEAIDEITAFIEAHNEISPSFMHRAKEMARAGEVKERIERLRRKLDDAIHTYEVDSGVQLQIDVQSLHVIVERLEQSIADGDEAVLRSHFPSVVSSWDPSKACLEQTREPVIQEIVTWARRRRPDSSNVFWLQGMAGCGKTTIAHSVAKELSKDGFQGTVVSFFFKRGVGDRDKPELVFSVLARDLSQVGMPLRRDVMTAIRRQDTLCGESSSMQLNELLLKPVESLIQRGLVSFPVTVIWDAFDECGDANSRKVTLELWAANVKRLAPILQFVVTSRPESDIIRVMTTIVKPRELVLEPSTDGTSDDIRLFINHHLARIALERRITLPWPTEEDKEALVRRAGGLFIWASTTIALLGEAKPKKMLKLLRQPGPLSNVEGRIDQLYTFILQNAIRPASVHDFQIVVGAIVVLFDPLSATGVASLVGSLMDEENDIDDNVADINDLVQSVRSVLHINTLGTITVLHQSFPDFLSSAARCTLPEFRIDVDAQHVTIALQCLRLLHGELKRDILQLGDSAPMNCDVPDLDSSLRDRLSESQRYACMQWASHLDRVSSGSPELEAALDVFFYNDALAWLEVMSLLGVIPQLMQSLRIAQKWTSKHCSRTALYQAAYDTLRFAESFHYVIAEHASHIYRSAIAFTPQGTAFYQRFYPKYCAPNGPEVLQGHKDTWSTCRMTLDFPDLVSSACISKDGRKIMAGLESEGVIVARDADTGQQLLEPFQAHDVPLLSLCLSEDGQKLVSASGDTTVKVWDAATGRQLGESLRRHSDTVTSVCVSMDGHKIVSGSDDGTVKVWDMETRQVLRDLQHDEEVTSVSISSTRMQVVSGTRAGNLYMWDVGVGVDLLQVWKGHTTKVTALCADSTASRIVSASDDHLVKVWDGRTRDLLLEIPHEEGVLSACLSKDGQKIVSGSMDGIVRLWCARSGKLLRTHVGHTDGVMSVDISEHGQKLLSSSADGTVRIWDLSSDQPECLSNAKEPTWLDIWVHLRVSSDGRKGITGHGNGNIRVWDMHSGALLLDVQGHADRIVGLCLSNEDQRIISESRDGAVKVWDMQTGGCLLCLREPGEERNAVSLRVRKDGMAVASASDDGVVEVWDSTSGRLLHKLHIGGRDAYQYIDYTRLSIDDRKLTSLIYATRTGYDFAYYMSVWELGTGELLEKAELQSPPAEWDEYGPYSMDRLGWIVSSEGKRIIWVPPEHRDMYAFSRTHAILGTRQGKVTILRLGKST